LISLAAGLRFLPSIYNLWYRKCRLSCN